MNAAPSASAAKPITKRRMSVTPSILISTGVKRGPIEWFPNSRQCVGAGTLRSLRSATPRQNVQLYSKGSSDESFPAYDLSTAGAGWMVRVSTTAHDRLWVHAAWLRQACARQRGLHRHFDAMGLPMPALLGWATMLVEIVG